MNDRPHRYRNLPKLWAYIRLAVQVEAAIQRFEPPATECVTANAYDFRIADAPTARRINRALRYLGIFNGETIDKIAHATKELNTLCYYWTQDNDDCSRIERPEMAKRIVAFRNYDQVRKGNKRWKLLPKL